MQVSYQMLSLVEDLLTVLRMVTRASTLPTLRESSLTGLSRDCPAKAVEAHAVAAAMVAADEVWQTKQMSKISKRGRSREINKTWNTEFCGDVL